MPQLVSIESEWLPGLVAPDALFSMNSPFNDQVWTINVLPVLLALMSYVHIFLVRERLRNYNGLSMWKSTFWLMPSILFLLAYSLPAALLIYWLVVQIWLIVMALLRRLQPAVPLASV